VTYCRDEQSRPVASISYTRRETARRFFARSVVASSPPRLRRPLRDVRARGRPRGALHLRPRLLRRGIGRARDRRLRGRDAMEGRRFAVRLRRRVAETVATQASVSTAGGSGNQRAIAASVAVTLRAPDDPPAHRALDDARTPPAVRSRRASS
jgi:hypothetical protein